MYFWVWDYSLSNFMDRIYAQTACYTTKTKENVFIFGVLEADCA